MTTNLGESSFLTGKHIERAKKTCHLISVHLRNLREFEKLTKAMTTTAVSEKERARRLEESIINFGNMLFYGEPRMRDIQFVESKLHAVNELIKKLQKKKVIQLYDERRMEDRYYQKPLEQEEEGSWVPLPDDDD